MSTKEDQSNANRIEDDEITQRCGAHHEAGHVVVAGTSGLRLRPEGLMIDRRGWGLACYFREPQDSDVGREAVVLASLAGFKAENELRRRSSYGLRDPHEIIDSCDWREGRTLVAKLSEGYFVSDNVGTLLRKFEDRAERLVVERWRTIEAVAGALLGNEWEPLKPLKSGGSWRTRTKGPRNIFQVRESSQYCEDTELWRRAAEGF